MSKTRREFGDELEEFVVSLLKPYYPNVRRSNGSGNKGEKGDIAGQDGFVIECKNRDTENINIKEKVWNKLCNEVSVGSKREPILILGNKNKKRWVIMDIMFFIKLLKNYEK